MSNEQDDGLKRLLSNKGSIEERTRIARRLPDERLRMAAPYSAQANEELKHRRAALALQSNKRWSARPVGIIILGVVASVFASLILWAILR